MPRTERPATAKPAIPTQPGFGAAPLPEISQPLQPGAGGVVYADGSVMDPARRARENARTLAPLVFDKPALGAPAAQLDPFYARSGGHAVIDPPAPTTPMPSQSSTIKRVRRPTVLADGPGTSNHALPSAAVTTSTEQAAGAVAEAMAEVAPAGLIAAAGEVATAPDPDAPVDLRTAPVALLPEADRARMPAASDSDSPAAGIPRGPVRPGKEITGGFGAPANLQYFALNGQELLKLLDAQLGALYDRCQNDLRFNEGLCYPRVTMRVVVEVRGFVSDNDFTVERLQLPDDPATQRNPIEFCREIADEVAFVVLEEMREVAEDGSSVTPPGMVRAELGLAQPGKRRVKQGAAGSTFVDVVG